MLWGHGLRERLCMGPRAPGEKPIALSVMCRRYQCQACDAVILVVPRGVARRKHYATTAIAWALALLGLLGCTWKSVRQAVSVWPLPKGDVVSDWRTLRRWIADLSRGALFGPLIATPPDATAQEVAERAAMALSALTPPSMRSLPIDTQAFLGGAQMV